MKDEGSIWEGCIKTCHRFNHCFREARLPPFVQPTLRRPVQEATQLALLQRLLEKLDTRPTARGPCLVARVRQIFRTHSSILALDAASYPLRLASARCCPSKQPTEFQTMRGEPSPVVCIDSQRCTTALRIQTTRTHVWKATVPADVVIRHKITFASAKLQTSNEN